MTPPKFTQGATPSFNKDLTATQQVASPKSASQTSPNPNIKLNKRLAGEGETPVEKAKKFIEHSKNIRRLAGVEG